MYSYEGKIAFIPGGSMGIGAAIASELAMLGVGIVLFARNEDMLLSTQQRLKKISRHPSQLVNYYVLDATDFASVQHTFAIAIEKHGTPYFLINCIGIARPNYFENIHPNDFDTIIKTNLYTIWNTTHVLVPYLRKKQRGHIINISSVAGYIGVFGYTDYSMTKFGIIGFSESLRQELYKDNIYVSILCPPDTDTPGLAEENKTKPKETIAIGGKAALMQPETVARALIRSIPKHSAIIYPNFDSRFSVVLKRLFPSLVDRIIKNTIRKVQK